MTVCSLGGHTQNAALQLIASALWPAHISLSLTSVVTGTLSGVLALANWL
jgi:hypothetical protein